MNKGNITGWKDVFSFTFKQTMKSKSFIVSFIIMLVLATGMIPLMSIINNTGSKDSKGTSPIKKVYIDNKTALTSMDFADITKNKTFLNTTFEIMKEDYNTVSSRIEKKEQSSVILKISLKNNMYNLDFVKSGNGPIKDSNMYVLSDAVVKQFDTNKIKVLGITDKQATMVNAAVDTKVSKLDVSGKEIVKKDTSISDNQYWFVYAIIFIILMVNSIASSPIATSIVTEKSTRVIEYLLTSVKPLALIVGKILAMLTVSLTEMVVLITMVFTSNKVTSIFISNGENVLSKYLPSNVFKNINLVNLVICILFILLGLIFYATLAGLAGATISKLEELQEGLKLYTFTTLIGVYIAFIAISMLKGGDNGFATFALLFPISSPYLLPGAVLIGKVSLPIAAASFALLVIVNVLLFRFVAKVFETLILQNGNRIKLKDLFKLFKAA